MSNTSLAIYYSTTLILIPFSICSIFNCTYIFTIELIYNIPSIYINQHRDLTIILYKSTNLFLILVPVKKISVLDLIFCLSVFMDRDLTIIMFLVIRT